VILEVKNGGLSRAKREVGETRVEIRRETDGPPIQWVIISSLARSKTLCRTNMEGLEA